MFVSTADHGEMGMSDGGMVQKDVHLAYQEVNLGAPRSGPTYGFPKGSENQKHLYPKLILCNGSPIFTEPMNTRLQKD